jgi:hypothetical protein
VSGDADKREEERRARLAAELRENLKRRKAQARARRTDARVGSTASEDKPSPEAEKS